MSKKGRKACRSGVYSIQRRLSEIGFRSYSEYLTSLHWQELKRRFFNSRYATRTPDGKLCCETCRKTDLKLSVHHRTYKRLGCEWTMDLCAVCDPCHKAIHDYAEAGDLWRATILIKKSKGRPLMPRQTPWQIPWRKRA